MGMKKVLCALATAPLAMSAAWSQEARVLPETVVSAGRVSDTGTTIQGEGLASARWTTNDSARLLDSVPGVSFYTGGGVSSLPVIDGLADDRLRILVDGMSITSSCPNHMNPALSYIDPAAVASVNVLAGITPVSLGGDSIGGTIAIRSADPVFAGAGESLKVAGSLAGFYRGNGSVSGGNAQANLASENFYIGYSGATVKSGNYKDGDGRVQRSTEYKSENNLVTLATRFGRHVLSLDAGWQNIPYQAYANQYMDMTSNKGESANLHYKGGYDWGELDARAFRQHVRHKMDMLTDKAGLGWVMPMDTEGLDTGYSVQASLPLASNDVVHIGHEYHRYMLDDWWPAFGMFADQDYWNIKGGKRERLALYGEWDATWTPAWTSQLGARVERVTMNTGSVQGYYSDPMVDMGVYQTDADAFNAKDHKRTDNNVDLTAVARYQPDANSTYDFGLARKTRSPNLYERFAWSNEWMAGTMVSWFGDLNAYVGNPDLKPEVAYSLRGTADWHDVARTDWQVKATPFYTRVNNYINAIANPVMDPGMDMMASPGRVRLQFVNHDARLYGIDLSAKKFLGRGGGEWTGRAIFSYVRGKDLDTGGNLYNIMPLNARLALDHALGAWTSSIELHAVAAKKYVDSVRQEFKTGSYTLVNLRTGYNWGKVRVDAGIDNLFDKRYDLPLGGMDAYEYRYVAAYLAPVRGMGRSINIGVTASF
jgi:iron complex outermembrane receptor protein